MAKPQEVRELHQLKRLMSHATMALAEAGLVALLVVGLVAGTAFAGKGGAITSSLRIDDGVFAGTTVAHRGSASATWVQARCRQGGVVVYEQFVKFTTEGIATLTLGPTPMWTSGSAACEGFEGYVRNGRWRAIGSATFAVSG